MATTSAAPAAPPKPAAPGFFENILTQATTSFRTIWTSIAGMFGSTTAGGIIAFLLSKVDPGISTIIIGVLGAASVAVGLAASIYHLISHVSATNNATIMLAEKVIDELESLMGMPITDFTASNTGVAPAVARAPASQQ